MHFSFPRACASVVRNAWRHYQALRLDDPRLRLGAGCGHAGVSAHAMDADLGHTQRIATGRVDEPDMDYQYLRRRDDHSTAFVSNFPFLQGCTVKKY